MTPHLRLRLLWLAALPVLWLSACLKDDPAPKFDCTNIPDAPLSINQLEVVGVTSHPSGYHDLAFDRHGWVAGYDSTNLVRANREMQVQVITSLIGSAEGMEYLPDGRLIVATSDGQGIVAISPDGALVPLAPDLNTFSVVVGPDGLIYSADSSEAIYRIDPDTGAREVFFRFKDYPEFQDCGDSCPAPRTVNFSVDYSKMTIGTFGEPVYRIDLDGDMDLVGEPELIANLPGGAHWVDGQAVDVCGNLYFPVYPEWLYRVSPDGTVSTYHHWADSKKYGHGLKWGSGLGGFRRDALYSPQPWNDSQYTVVEVVVGVPGHPPGGFPGQSADGDPHELTCGASGRRTRAPSLALLFALALFVLRRRRPASGGVRHSKDVIPD